MTCDGCGEPVHPYIGCIEHLLKVIALLRTEMKVSRPIVQLTRYAECCEGDDAHFSAKHQDLMRAYDEALSLPYAQT